MKFIFLNSWTLFKLELHVRIWIQRHFISQHLHIVGKFVSNSICFERSICWLKNLLCWHYDHSLLIELALLCFPIAFPILFFYFIFIPFCWLKNFLCWRHNHILLIWTCIFQIWRVTLVIDNYNYYWNLFSFIIVPNPLKIG